MHDAKITHSCCDNKFVQAFEIIISIVNAELGKFDFVHTSNTVNYQIFCANKREHSEGELELKECNSFS